MVDLQQMKAVSQILINTAIDNFKNDNAIETVEELKNTLNKLYDIWKVEEYPDSPERTEIFMLTSLMDEVLNVTIQHKEQTCEQFLNDFMEHYAKKEGGKEDGEQSI